MEVNPGVFTSNLSAEEWEPDTDPPGKVQFSDELGCLFCFARPFDLNLWATTRGLWLWV